MLFICSHGAFLKIFYIKAQFKKNNLKLDKAISLGHNPLFPLCTGACNMDELPESYSMAYVWIWRKQLKPELLDIACRKFLEKWNFISFFCIGLHTAFDLL